MRSGKESWLVSEKMLFYSSSLSLRPPTDPGIGKRREKEIFFWKSEKRRLRKEEDVLYWGSVCRNLPSPPSFLLLCHQSPTKIEDETAKKERKKKNRLWRQNSLLGSLRLSTFASATAPS